MPNNRLRQLRNERNLSQKDVAEKIKIPQTTYSGYENNKREPNSEMLITLADFFNCSVDYLIGRTDERVDEAMLDRVLESDNDLLEQYGNLYEAKKAQKLRDDNTAIEQIFADTVTRKEIEHITKYRTLDGYGKRLVDNVLDIEYERCSSEENRPAIITYKHCHANKAAAGLGYDLSNNDEWKSVKIYDCPEAHKADFAVEIDGDSMEPTYHSGDIVFIIKTEEIPAGKVGLFVYNGKGYVKEAGDGCMVSHNEAYDDIYPEYGEIKAVGRVIGVTKLAE